MKKSKNSIIRKIVQGIATIANNWNIKGLLDGSIYQGKAKGICSPGLNCYSCPAATGACPLGSLQNSLAGWKGKWNTYLVGCILLFGATLGRFICGWLCPFGLFQELLYKIPAPKWMTSLKKLRWLKYFILAGLVILYPIVSAIHLGYGIPAFCKYICPEGTLAGALLLSVNEQLRPLAGNLFWLKISILVLLIIFSIFVFRPFCRCICPLGAIYGLFNKVAVLRMETQEEGCLDCAACSEACPVRIHPVKECNSVECIRCGKCIDACPKERIHYKVAGKTIEAGK